jgi:hypothetical protein
MTDDDDDTTPDLPLLESPQVRRDWLRAQREPVTLGDVTAWGCVIVVVLLLIGVGVLAVAVR